MWKSELRNAEAGLMNAGVNIKTYNAPEVKGVAVRCVSCHSRVIILKSCAEIDSASNSLLS